MPFCGVIRYGPPARRPQTDRQCRRSHMAGSIENSRQSHSDFCASHLCIYSGAVVVAGGSHTLGDAYSCKRLRNRSAIQCVLQDSVPGCRNFDRHVGGYHFPLADLVWGSLSEDFVGSTQTQPMRLSVPALGITVPNTLIGRADEVIE